jgi:hypothetical protein
MADNVGDIEASRRDLIKKTAWAVPAIVSFNLVTSSPAGAFSRRPKNQPPNPGHGGNQTQPGQVSNQPPKPGHGGNQPPKPGHGSNQTQPGHGGNQPPKPGYGNQPPKPGHGSNLT